MSPNTTNVMRSPDPDHPFGESRSQLLTDDDGERVGRHHSECRPQPRSDEPVGGGEGDRCQHGLVAEFRQEECQANGEEYRLRALLGA